jgi:putative aldouronate transport system substrate-binding protein
MSKRFNKSSIASRVILGGFAAASTLAVGLAQSNAPVTITYTYPGGEQRDVAAVQDALNVILKRKVNAQIELRPIDWGAFDQKMKLSFAAGEKCDLVFTAPWINNYFQNIAQGNLLPLDDLLTQFAPRTYRSMTPATWEATKVDNKIYGVINQQPQIRAYGIQMRKDLADKYKVNLKAITRWEDLEPFFAAIKKGEPDVTPMFTAAGSSTSALFHAEYYGFDPIIENIGVFTRYDDPNVKVVNGFDTTEFRNSIALARKWYQAGYVTKDLPTLDNAKAAFKNLKYQMQVGPVNADSAFYAKNEYGFDFVVKPLSKGVKTTNGVIATMNGICRTSANPQAAMKVLEVLNTDATAYNTLAKGVEGRNWQWQDKAKKVIQRIDAKNEAYNPSTDWMFGSIFNAYYNDPGLVGTIQTMKKANANSIPSTALGFTFDAEKVKSELARVSAVVKEQGEPLMYGLVDPVTALPTYLNALKAAGMDAIVTETQRQLTEWKNNKK